MLWPGGACPEPCPKGSGSWAMVIARAGHDARLTAIHPYSAPVLSRRFTPRSPVFAMLRRGRQGRSRNPPRAQCRSRETGRRSRARRSFRRHRAAGRTAGRGTGVPAPPAPATASGGGGYVRSRADVSLAFPQAARSIQYDCTPHRRVTPEQPGEASLGASAPPVRLSTQQSANRSTGSRGEEDLHPVLLPHHGLVARQRADVQVLRIRIAAAKTGVERRVGRHHPCFRRRRGELPRTGTGKGTTTEVCGASENARRLTRRTGPGMQKSL